MVATHLGSCRRRQHMIRTLETLDEIDDRIGAGIIKEVPGGKRFRIEIAAGVEVVTESIPLRI
jgi:hypothetical protein